MKLGNIDIYISIWAVFHIGRYLEVSGITLLLLILFIWSLYDMYMLHRKTRLPRFVRVYDIMFVMFMFYGAMMFLGITSVGRVELDDKEIKSTDYLIKILQSLAPFYTFYRNALKNKYDIHRINAWSVVFIVVAGLDYLLQLRNSLMSHLGDEVVNNGSYVVLCLVPIICLFKNKLIQIVALLLCVFTILMAFKRGPILIMAICAIYYLYYTVHSTNNKFWVFALLFGAIVAGYYALNRFILSSDLFQARLELTMEGYNSGRDDIVSNLLDAFKNSNIFNMVFGHGAYGTVLLTGRLAHNDWIQILIDEGIMGIIIHASFCWQLFLLWKNTPKETSEKLSLGTFVIIYLFTTMFSMAFDRIPVYEMVVLAYCAANYGVKIKTVRQIA